MGRFAIMHTLVKATEQYGCTQRITVKMCHITFTLESFSRTTLSIKMLVAYLSHLHLTQLASQMLELPIQGFSLRKNQRSSKWIQSNFPTSWLSKHWNTCMDYCHVLKKWLWMHAKVFSTAINTGLLLQSPACQCVCVCVCVSLCLCVCMYVCVSQSLVS